MEIEDSKFHRNLNENEEDIENIEKIAEGLINNHHHIEKERKKKFSKKTNRFHELNLFLNTIPTETKKLTRDEKKIVEYQRRFDQMEEKNKKKKKAYKNERKKLKIANDVSNGLHDVKTPIEDQLSSQNDDKCKESNNSNIEAKSSKSQTETIVQRIKAPDTQINPSFNLENYDNLFYYLYYYVKSERKTFEELKDKEFNGEQISQFKLNKEGNSFINSAANSSINTLGKKINKVDETVFQKTKFIQDSIRRKFKENMDKMNVTSEKDLLVRDFARKFINKEEINNLLEKEFSYY